MIMNDELVASVDGHLHGRGSGMCAPHLCPEQDPHSFVILQPLYAVTDEIHLSKLVM